MKMTGSDVSRMDTVPSYNNQTGKVNRIVVKGQIHVENGEKEKMRESKRKLTDDPVLLRILGLLKEKGKTEKDMVEHLGIGNGAFTHWKYENQKSFHQHIRTMAEYLDVTPNYLLYGRDEEVNGDTLSASEIRLVRLYRQMGIGQKECLMHTADWFVNALDNEKNT